MTNYICYVDGGLNGHGAYGSYVIICGDCVLRSETFMLPTALTSNEAEYQSLIMLLTCITTFYNNHRGKWLINTDSKLMVNQLDKFKPWRVCAESLKPLNQNCKKFFSKVNGVVNLNWVPREVIVSYLGH